MGAEFACAVTSAGGVQCWGANGSGQLGTGTTFDAEVATDVPSLHGGVVEVASGLNHACAVMATGTVRCWGANDQGQAGIPGFVFALPVPTEVPGIHDAVAVTAGHVHTCVLTAAGAVKCWGNNYYGQLGDGSGVSGAAVVEVAGLGSGAVAVTAGHLHTCAIAAGGAAKCWGANVNGALGNGTAVDASIPVDVSGLSGDVIAMAAGGSHTCAIVVGGTVKCWGLNAAGQLGAGTTTEARTPVDVTGLPGAAQALALGTFHTCAVVAGGAWCWGDNQSGQLGIGTTTNALQAVAALGLSGTVAGLAANGMATCAVLADGTARCWGANRAGGLGIGFSARVRRPEEVVGLAGVNAVATGEDHSCALAGAGTVKCWGRNFSGQLGNGSTADAFAPVDVPLGVPVLAVRAGGYASCAITGGGGLKCWGALTGTTVPVDVPAFPSGVADVALGFGHACALTNAGDVKCWGANDHGQIGVGTRDAATSPMDVPGLGADVVAVGAGQFHSCAVMNDTSVRCWGSNEFGQVDGTPGQDALTPVLVSALVDGALAVDGGHSHTCAQTAAYGSACWGANGYAQLGLNNQHALPGVHPTPLPTGTFVAAAGAMHSCQLGGAGVVRCWGSNGSGQVGVGTIEGPAIVRVPTVVPGLGATTSVSASGSHTCVVEGDRAKCWGSNGFGQVGNGAGGYATTPQPVLAGLCGGFADVVAGDPFCASVAWNRNRLVTQGCAAGMFCRSQDVSRLAMAAFAKRAGAVLEPVVATTEAASGPLDPDTLSIVCPTDALAAAEHPRSARVDAVLSASAAADVGFAIQLMRSDDGGASWLWIPSSLVRTSVRAGMWTSVATRGSGLVAAGTTVRFGLMISRDGLPGTAAIAEATCVLRVLAYNAPDPGGAP